MRSDRLDKPLVLVGALGDDRVSLFASRAAVELRARLGVDDDELGMVGRSVGLDGS
jgi:hypothetical protein